MFFSADDILLELSGAFRNEQCQNSKNVGLKKSIDYIYANFKNGTIDVSYLAKIACISESHFRKLFKQIYGISPNKYITNLRLEYAAQLLKGNYYRVNEVCYKSGFNDTKNFIKIFKNKYGTTPKKYQNVCVENLKD